jgi:uncharacterized membrane protein YdjX (TVP38/TMEM64 family)
MLLLQFIAVCFLAMNVVGDCLVHRIELNKPGRLAMGRKGRKPMLSRGNALILPDIDFSPVVDIASRLRGGGLEAVFTAAKEVVTSMGPAAPVGLSAAYLLCEFLSIPAVPLAVFSGALYGVFPGTCLILSCGVFSAACMFYIGRLYRQRISTWLKARPMIDEKFKILDRVIYKGGARAIFLLRITPNPIPFMNYLYGITSISPTDYVLGTALGFLPGTIIIVYSGAAGREVLSGGLQQPWYVYAGVVAVTAILGKVCSDTLDRLKAD